VTDGSHRSGISALVADDDDQNARLLVRILEHGGYSRIECTTESAKVLPLCDELKPDLLLLDVSMPSPNGFEILESLEERPGTSPTVVMLTGHDHPSIERRALELGAAAVVGKTTSMQELLDRLDAILVKAGRIPDEDVGT
jgi:putative two-component system response regulator